MTYFVRYDLATGTIKESGTICSTPQQEQAFLETHTNALKIEVPPTQAALKNARVDIALKKVTGLTSAASTITITGLPVVDKTTVT